LEIAVTSWIKGQMRQFRYACFVAWRYKYRRYVVLNHP
jgi:hypothetical protein